MQQRLLGGPAGPESARPYRVPTVQEPPSLSELLARRSMEARENTRQRLLAEVQRNVAALVRAAGADCRAGQ
jgi:hypothetical protein